MEQLTFIEREKTVTGIKGKLLYKLLHINTHMLLHSFMHIYSYMLNYTLVGPNYLSHACIPMHTHPYSRMHMFLVDEANALTSKLH